jgi:glucose dehydrogenase
MIQRLRPRGCCAAAFTLVVSFAAVAQASSVTIKPAPAFSEKQLAAPPVNGWITNGGSLSNERYSPLEQINRDNIRDVKAVAWEPSTPARRSRSCTTACCTW